MKGSLTRSERPSKRDCWTDKAKEQSVYGIPHGRLWRVYERIENPHMRPTLKEQYEELKETLTFEKIYDEKRIKATRGSNYFKVPCPNPSHEDKNPSCVCWPNIKAFKCFSCGSSGDIIEYLRLLNSSEGAQS